MWFIPLVDDILEKTNIGEGKIVDVACGPGFLVKELARRSKKFHVTGVDVSSQAIDHAKKNCKGLRNVELKFASVYGLPFLDDSIDLVVCRDSFHHFGRPQKALREMTRILKPGGYLYMQDLRRDLPRYLLAQALPRENVFQKLQFYSVRASYTKGEIKTMLEKASLDGARIKTRYMTKEMKRRYAKNIPIASLRGSFQAHYVVFAKKK